VYCLGLIYTDNISEGLFDLEVKLSLLIFPIILSIITPEAFNKVSVNMIFRSFLAGNILATLICFVNAIVSYISTGNVSDFYYSKLSVLLHPGYFSMYLSLGVAITLNFLYSGWNNLSGLARLFYILLVVWFFTFIILLSSKAGIISIGLVLIIYFGYDVLRSKAVYRGLLSLFMVFLAFYIAFHVFPRSFGRIEAARDVIVNTDDISTDTKEGTAERILIWKASLRIIKKNVLFGVGTGDVEDELQKEYIIQGYSTAFERTLNAHNQYLQSFIAFGVLGILVFLGVIIIPMYFSLKDGHIVYFLFLVIIGFNFLVESMLERQAGVIFYAFFNSYFFMIKKRP
jgi:O-antigen ligase